MLSDPVVHFVGKALKELEAINTSSACRKIHNGR
jgi:hypothetical protein